MVKTGMIGVVDSFMKMPLHGLMAEMRAELTRMRVKPQHFPTASKLQ